jgi:formate dehydrogenase alpha subunit
MAERVQITIDGKEISAEKGANLLVTARENGFDIPSLCFLEKLTPTAACRMCIVKIEGRRGLVTACSTQVEEGLRITAFDDEIEKFRKTTLELHLAEHEYDCSVCDANGECELQDLAYRYDLGVEKNRTIPSLSINTADAHIRLPHDKTSPVLEYDAKKCIRCGRCVRACDEIQEKGVLDFLHRGSYTFISPEFGAWKGSSCDGCGECVQLCPTAALTEKPLVERFRPFDAEKKVTTTCVYCGVGCQLDMWVKNDKIVRVRGAEKRPNNGRLCVKGRFGYEFIHSSERLQRPLVKRKGEFFETDWDEALDIVATRFKQIQRDYGSDALAGLSSAKCSNEENYIFQKFVRSVFGTNNVDHCARLCHAPTVAGLGTAFGSGAMTNSIPELADADCILVTGSNVTETHPVTATYIKNAVRKGAKLIVVDPRRIDLVTHAHIWVRQNPGSDVAWINGIMNVILEEGLQDNQFISDRTEGFEEMAETLKQYTPEKVEEISGILAEKIREIARLYALSTSSSIVYAMGITQHTTGTDNVLSLANLAMVAGQIGRPSTGVNPLRGQNNVQGAGDMAALPNIFPGYQKVTDPDSRKKFAREWNVESLPAEPGLTVTEIMNAALDKRVRGLYIMGENPMLSDPNLQHVEEALKALDFLVVQDIFLSETARFADVVLPAASFAEKEGTFTNSGRSVLRVRKTVEAPGAAKPDWKIVTNLAQRMGYSMSYNSAADIMDEIARVAPIYGGISYKRLETEELHWPCPTADHPGTLYLHKGEFKRGKGKFHPVDYLPPAERPDSKFPLILSTGRMLYHYHTATMTRRSKPLNTFARDAYVEINVQDLEQIGACDGCRVRVITRRGDIEIFARESDRVAPGVVFIPFHFHESPANRLTNDVLDPVAKIPELKVAACRIEKME